MPLIENLDEINKNLDPVEVLNFIGYEGSKPSLSGGEVRDYCPIHKGDKQQSLSINKGDNVGCCHSCGFRGNLIQIYKTAKGINSLPMRLKRLRISFLSRIQYKEGSYAKRTPQQVLNESSEKRGPSLFEKEKAECLARRAFWKR